MAITSPSPRQETARRKETANPFQYGILPHHVFRISDGTALMDYDTLALDRDMMLTHDDH